MATKSKLLLLNNSGMIEIDRIVTGLYSKGLVTKDEIKELINTLKLLVENLPDQKEKHLH